MGRLASSRARSAICSIAAESATFVSASAFSSDSVSASEGGFSVLCTHATAYPPLLRQLSDPPAVLFAAGSDETFAVLRDEPAVAVVGTRRASPYGTEVAYAIGRGLGASGVPVVSGLALGIDAASHEGALSANGLTIAVCGCGLDVMYPRRHVALAARIRERGAHFRELGGKCT